MLDSLVCIEYVTSADAFNDRLNAAAPAATKGGITTLIPAPEPRAHATTTPVPPSALAAPPHVAPLGYTYVFQLDDFERGEFTAARYDYLAVRPRGAWVCVARSDEEALAMARQAALLEWAPPQTRRAEDFSVRFVDGKPTSPRRR